MDPARSGDRGAETPRKEDHNLKTIDKALEAARAAQEKKATDLSLIDVEGRCSYADAILIASAGSERQASAIADSIETTLKSDHQLRPVLREAQGGWKLLDYGDLVVHVFIDELRSYYDIDKLWGDAPRVSLATGKAVDTTLAEARPRVLAQRRRFLH
jgi:ribosome-associated protein